MRNFFRKKVSLILVVSVFLNSCGITRYGVWDNHYEEKFTEFTIDELSSEVILIGSRFEYHIQDHDDRLKQVLLPLSSNKGIDARIYLRLIKDNDYKADFYFDANTDKISDDVIKFIKKIPGAKFKNDKGNLLLYMSFSLKDMVVIRHSKLENVYQKKYQITFEKDFATSPREEVSKTKLAGKIAITPLAVAADIILIPGYILGFIFGIVGMGVSQANSSKATN